jgi:hypothetical protein
VLLALQPLLTAKGFISLLHKAAGLLKYIVDQSTLKSVRSQNNNYGYNAAIKPLLKLRYDPLILFAKRRD